MFFETLLQSKIFLCTMYFGILGGICLTAIKMLQKVFSKKVFVIVGDILLSLVFAVLFLSCINIFNFGCFRLYELIGFVLGIVLEQISLNNLVEKFLNLIYTLTRKFCQRLKKSKIFGKIVK